MKELWFFHSAHCLMLIDISMKFHKDSLNGFQVIVRTQLRHDFVIDEVPREITQKVKRQELCFLHSAHRLMLIDICMMFHKDSLNGFQVIGWKQLRHDFVMDKVPREITQKV